MSKLKALVEEDKKIKKANLNLRRRRNRWIQKVSKLPRDYSEVIDNEVWKVEPEGWGNTKAYYLRCVAVLGENEE